MVNQQVSAGGVRIAVDRGGTFCDIYASIPLLSYHEPPSHLIGNAVIIRPAPDDFDTGSVEIQLKLLSVDPQNYNDAPSEGIRRIMQIFKGVEITKGDKIDTTGVDSVRMGTTVATNVSLSLAT